MRFAYDLDGTLADTRTAVLEAYRRVGVEPPADFFGKPWREWLQDRELHTRKNAVYEEMVRKHVTPTKIRDLYLLTGGFIITGASRPAAELVMRKIGVIAPLHTELSMHQKAAVLNMTSESGIVFEDSITVAKYLKENTGWTVCHVL